MKDSPDIDPYRYTSGRWLRDDELQLKARHISFDFNALCQRVIAVCPGASAITSWNKEEGGFNRVFAFATNNAKRLVAKLPFSLAGPPRLMTNSEVATMMFLQQHSNIPIPRVLDWSDDSSNEIGSEYIIMEHAVGVQLHARWPSMDGAQRIECIKNIYQTFRQIDDLRFPAYGSLYAADAPVKFTTISLDNQYRIGPHCGVRYWDCNLGEHRHAHQAPPNRGPWTDFGAWTGGLIDAGISRIPPFDNMAPKKPRYFGSVDMHFRLLSTGRLLLKKLSEDAQIRSVAKPMIFHPDLHKRNIFVSEDDPTAVTHIIDWQSTSIEPAFWYVSQIPDFGLVSNHDIDSADPTMVACAKAVEFSMLHFLPRLAGPRSLNPSLFRPFLYCYRIWNDGVAAFRHEVIETSKDWAMLRLEGSCPISIPSAEELNAHQKDYKLFEAAHTLRHHLASLLDASSDGWVPWHSFEATKTRQRVLYEDALQAVRKQEGPDDDEPVKSEEDLKAIWPFDL